MDPLRLIYLDKRRLQDFEHLLSGKEFGGCYCAAWSNWDKTWDERCKTRPQENLEHTRNRVVNRQHVGYLVERESDGAVVAWTGSGPKTAFPRMKERPGSRTGAFDAGVWAIGCLSIARSYRGLGYARQIVEALIEEARRAGAKSIEVYPVEPAGDDQAFRGSKTMYEALGFTVAAQEQEGNYTCLRMEKILQPARAPAPHATDRGALAEGGSAGSAERSRPDAEAARGTAREEPRAPAPHATEGSAPGDRGSAERAEPARPDAPPAAAPQADAPLAAAPQADAPLAAAPAAAAPAAAAPLADAPAADAPAGA